MWSSIRQVGPAAVSRDTIVLTIARDALIVTATDDAVAATGGATRICCEHHQSCNPATFLLASMHGHLSPLYV